jgi:hypothetical protein
MPRKSPEDRASVNFRFIVSPPEPPPGLNADATALWRKTVAERPADWFSPVAQRLLATLVTQISMCDTWQKAVYDQKDYRAEAQALKQYLAISASCAGIAARLRLVPQALIDRRSGQISEKGLGDADDGLLGGKGREWSLAREKTAVEDGAELSAAAS